ncbi:uncharacterized protein LAESUDRAFT_74816 [Laetiporus sulphureus 93-53]|uniref:DNA helicase Pif1-like 2B domain-containing protein n=1 Tax=Laetiporus sulphureus 93-53 TaxID=1314785 RepID=A0A165F033_9APHY|nr:uncharacterized protein LAESUDRAFT_74816 [Laetiporus sulphureus 93-53]KZT08086.1 hypothetical protein LAESUDRAFT_74816 [Laetiporus sulphureus 93-53]
MRKYAARDSGSNPRMLEQMVAPVELVLKSDAQVMLIKNVDERLVNGCVGRVLGFFSTAACGASVGMDGVLGASTGKKPRSSSQESLTSNTKGGGFVRNVQVGPDGRTPVGLCVEPKVENKENLAAPPVSHEVKGNTSAKPASAASPSNGGIKNKSVAKDEELFPLVEFRTAHGTEIVLISLSPVLPLLMVCRLSALIRRRSRRIRESLNGV